MNPLQSIVDGALALAADSVVEFLPLLVLFAGFGFALRLFRILKPF